MTKFIIQGGKKLEGEVTVGGSKNAALPILCATMLTKEETILENVPNIADIHSMIEIIRSMGAKVEFENGVLKIDPSKLEMQDPLGGPVKNMRASILVMGALLPRLGEVKMDFPGGCVLGKRSVDSHTHVFESLGCEVVDSSKGLHVRVKKLKGSKMTLPEMSVTATENGLMAAVLADGETEIRLAAAEPHVQDLCLFLNKMGAKISGIGTNNIKIVGVESLKGVKYKITGDYLEAGTFAIAAVGTGGDVLIKGINPDHLDSFWEKLTELGAEFDLYEDSVHIKPSKKLEAVKMLRTAVYPSFATDLQAPFAVLLTQAKGVSKVFETLFEGRLNYLFELEKMGAHIEFLNPHQALIIGPTDLKGIPISSCDIRAGAAMVIAALLASGQTEISNVYYIDRGYEDLDQKLRALGADIHRI